MAVIGTRKLRLEVESTDYSDSVSAVVITAQDKDTDFMSFAEALAGGAREYRLKMTVRQDTAAASLWYFIWDQLGEEVDIEVWPNGGSAEGVATPKFVGTAVVMEPDGDLLGGEADKSPTGVQVCEVEWVFNAKPVLDITP